jgi:hypothetical protein
MSSIEMSVIMAGIKGPCAEHMWVICRETETERERLRPKAQMSIESDELTGFNMLYHPTP